MIKLKCQTKDHQQKPIIALCLEESCCGKRKICEVCLRQNHSGHQNALLNINQSKSKIQNLSINFRNGNHTSKNKLQIFQNLSNLIARFNQIFKYFQQKKERLFNKNILIMCKSVIDSFSKQSSQNIINKITQINVSEEELQIIVSSICSLERSHLTDIDLLQKSVKCMTSKLHQSLNSCQNIFKDLMEQLERSIHQWSLFERLNWEQILMNMEEEDSIKEEKYLKQRLYQQNKSYNVLYTEYLADLEQKQKLIEKEQKNLIQLSKLYKWKPILQWVGKGNNIRNLSELKIGIPYENQEGNKNKHYKNAQIKQIKCFSILNNLITLRLFGNEINKISGLDNIKQLTLLDLSCNNIQIIQNVNHLQKLSSLLLNSNKILKIQNLQKLYNLHCLRLDNNSIRIIENLQELSSLDYLDLIYNPVEKSTQNQKTIELLKNRIQTFTYSIN